MNVEIEETEYRKRDKKPTSVAKLELERRFDSNFTKTRQLLDINVRLMACVLDRIT